MDDHFLTPYLTIASPTWPLRFYLLFLIRSDWVRRPGVEPHVFAGELQVESCSTFSHFKFFFIPGYAIPAVNCVSSSGINACLEAARKNDAPIIIQFSSGGSQVSNLSEPSNAVKSSYTASRLTCYMPLKVLWRQSIEQ